MNYRVTDYFSFVYQIVATKTAFVFKLSKLIFYLLGGE